nr:putative ribonuclease H-like domain-containing protein [Tanacetum cinerariifolium]
MMGLPNEHQLKFNSFKDAKTLMAAIEKRLGGNDATKKTQRNLLKQQYENFSRSSSESLDQTFDKLQKLVIWRNKPDLDTLSMDDLYNNLKFYEFEVKRISRSTNTQNMAFVSSFSNNSNNSNDVNTAQGVNTANRVNTASSQINAASSLNIDNLGDVVICAFLASQPNNTHLVNEDLEQIHPDDLAKIDLKWQMAMLTMRERIFLKNTGRKLNLNGNDYVAFDKTKVECCNCHKRGHFAREYRAPRGHDNMIRDVTRRTAEEGPTNYALMAYSTSSALSSDSKSKDKSNEVEPESVRKDSDALIIKDWVLDDEEEEVEKKEVQPNINQINFVKATIDNNPRETVKNGEQPKQNTHRKRDYKEIDGGYVAFGGNPKEGKITGKGKIKTGKLDFENVYFVRELKFDLFSVSQICDKKNSVLFTDTGCIVSDFKLIDENQILLRVSKQNNMYNIDLKNIVPTRGLTCLFAKATKDEYKLWHIRLGHLNFKTINKLVKGNLVRSLPSKIFENDKSCVACQKRKQYKASCKFDGKANEGFFVGYSLNSKAFKVFNSRTRIMEENLHVRFSENTLNNVGSGPNWLFDVDALTKTMNYQPVTVDSPFSTISRSTQDNEFQPSNDGAKKVDEDLRKENKCNDQGDEDSTNSTNRVNTVTSNINAASFSRVNSVGTNISIDLSTDPNIPLLEDIVSPIPTIRIYKDHPLKQVIGDSHLAPQTRRMSKNLEEHGLTTVKIKTVNDDVRLQALINGKKVVITEASIRHALKLNDAEGTSCLSNAVIFEELVKIGSKTTSWNEFSITMASAIICLANNQKFNFSKYILDNLKKNLEAGVPFYMFPRFIQVFINHQLGDMSYHKVTPLFGTMMVQALEEVGDLPTTVQNTPIPDAPSSSQHQRKHKPRRKERKETEVSPTEIHIDDHVPTTLNDPLPSGEDRIKLKELMDLCTNLSNKVLDLENEVIEIKSSHKAKIEELESKVEKLKEENMSLTKELKSFNTRVESPTIKETVVDKEESSKQRRKIADIDADAELTWRMIEDADVKEVAKEMVEVMEIAKIIVDEVSTVGGELDAANEKSVSAAPTNITTAQPSEATKTTADITTAPKAKGIVFHDKEESTTRTTSSKSHVKDKAKSKIEAEWNADIKDNIDWNEAVEQV